MVSGTSPESELRILFGDSLPITICMEESSVSNFRLCSARPSCSFSCFSLMMRAALEIADSRRCLFTAVGLDSGLSEDSLASTIGGVFSLESLLLDFSFSIYSSNLLVGGVDEGEGRGLQESNDEDVLSGALAKEIAGGIPRGLVLSRGLILVFPVGGGLSLIPLSLRAITRPEPRAARGEPPVLSGDPGGDPLFTFISAANSCSSLGLGGVGLCSLWFPPSWLGVVGQSGWVMSFPSTVFMYTCASFNLLASNSAWVRKSLANKTLRWFKCWDRFCTLSGTCLS